MVVTAQVKQPVEDQLFNFVRKSKAILFRLGRSALDRDYDFTELRLVLIFERLRFVRKRKHVGYLILAAKLLVEFPDRRVADEYDRDSLVAVANRLDSARCKIAPMPLINLLVALAVDDFDHDRVGSPTVREGYFGYLPSLTVGLLTLDLALLRMTLVGLDDHLHEL